MEINPIGPRSVPPAGEPDAAEDDSVQKVQQVQNLALASPGIVQSGPATSELAQTPSEGQSSVAEHALQGMVVRDNLQLAVNQTMEIGAGAETLAEPSVKEPPINDTNAADSLRMSEEANAGMKIAPNLRRDTNLIVVTYGGNAPGDKEKI